MFDKLYDFEEDVLDQQQIYFAQFGFLDFFCETLKKESKKSKEKKNNLLKFEQEPERTDANKLNEDNELETVDNQDLQIGKNSLR